MLVSVLQKTVYSLTEDNTALRLALTAAQEHTERLQATAAGLRSRLKEVGGEMRWGLWWGSKQGRVWSRQDIGHNGTPTDLFWCFIEDGIQHSRLLAQAPKLTKSKQVQLLQA